MYMLGKKSAPSVGRDPSKSKSSDMNAIHAGTSCVIQEIFATYIFIFAIIGAQHAAGPAAGTVPLQIAFAIGLAAFVLQYIIPDAHFNPWVSLAMMARSLSRALFEDTGKYEPLNGEADAEKVRQNPAFQLVTTILRIGAQILGGFLAGKTLQWFPSVPTSDVGLSLPEKEISDTAIATLEGLGLLLLLYAFEVGKRLDPEKYGDAASKALPSIALFLLVHTLASHTGGSFNLARGLGPAMVSNDYRGIWQQTAGHAITTMLVCVHYFVWGAATKM